ncbi:ribosome biogenesis GTP-binding protein YihA/YsxC [Rhodoligotrophos defluvii]|uniref:ribosome biogenesis GTP-binding protein YihA/YsxC n=1 Tax=Rhodoligotrophos defluvii TaxID=2561934 RepID=UPI0010CA006F|nr:ribosome biogenesis GTP-binding protein YihA/YsxC [Rhodoligotrophos defluvii]
MSAPDFEEKPEELFTEERLEAGRKLFAGEIDFLRGVQSLDGLPEPMACEVAFAGRSNVGKSSLLNALAGRKTLARTSSTPGRTRELNFFAVGPRLCLVDMPGYGYAQAEKSLVARWQALLRAYLRGRRELKRVFVLIDSRHGLKPADMDMLDLLDAAAVGYQVVLTKADKMKPAALQRIAEQVKNQLARRPAAHPRLHVTSAEKGTGIPELRAELASLAEQAS